MDKQDLNQKILIIIIAAIILMLLGVVLLQIRGKTVKKSSAPVPTPVMVLQKEAVIIMIDRGFNPQNLIVKKGTGFTFENKSKTDFEIVFPGQIKIFEGKFSPGTKAYAQVNIPTGTYDYFNKLNPDQKGSVIVEE